MAEEADGERLAIIQGHKEGTCWHLKLGCPGFATSSAELEPTAAAHQGWDSGQDANSSPDPETENRGTWHTQL